MGQLIPIIPKTSYDFDGRASTTQVVVLKDRIPTTDFASGVLVVRAYPESGLSSTAAANVKVYNVSESPEDKGTFFVGTTALATAGPIDDDTDAATLFTDDLAAPIGPMIRVTLEFAQGATEATTQTVTLAVDFVGREAS